MSFFVHRKPSADQGHRVNPKCVDEVLLGLDDDSSVTVRWMVVVSSVMKHVDDLVIDQALDADVRRWI